MHRTPAEANCSRGFTSNYRVWLLAGSVFASFGCLGARMAWLQTAGRGPLLASVEKARQAVITQWGRRGDIVDVHGNLLATSCPYFELGVDPRSERPEDRSKWPELARLLGMPVDGLQTILTTRYRAAAPAVEASADWGSATAAKAGWLGHAPTAHPGEGRPAPATAAGLVFNWKEGEHAADPDDDSVASEPDESGRREVQWAKLAVVPEATYDEVQKLGIRGVYGNKVYRRTYPNNRLAAHLVGFVNQKEEPMAGMEHFADFYLRGQNGWIESEKDGRQKELPQFRTREVPAADGYSVALSIDSTVQHIAEAELDEIARTCRPAKATIIVSDPRTGFVLALANYPSFNLNAYNELSRDQQAWMRNVAVADQYEPGSVFKIVAISGGLNDGLITPSTIFDCSIDKATDRQGIVHDLPREEATDMKYFVHPIPVSQVIAHSSNRGTAQVALMLGADRFYSYVRAFGFGERTGFPVGGEIEGTVAPPRKWDGLTITRMPIGQSIAVTPLQMNQAMAAIANGGVLLRPQVIDRIRNSQGDVVFSFGPVPVRRVISEAAARTMAKLLEGVASPGGTGASAAIPGYEVAGKTATAQKLEPEATASGRTVLRYSTTHHVSSFIGFFPASRPQVQISVIVDDSDEHLIGGVAFGSKVAAPAFRRIGEQLISYWHIPPPGLPNPVLALGGVGP